MISKQITIRIAQAALVAILLAVSGPLGGHHAGFFDQEKIITVSGVVTRFEWTNPHAYMYIDVEKSNGQVERWTVEGRSPNHLSRTGWTMGSIKPGEIITVTGSPPRDSSDLAESGALFLGAGPIELADGQQLIFGPIVPPEK
jgi:hypothetical protein